MVAPMVDPVDWDASPGLGFCDRYPDWDVTLDPFLRRIGENPSTALRAWPSDTDALVVCAWAGTHLVGIVAVNDAGTVEGLLVDPAWQHIERTLVTEAHRRRTRVHTAAA